MSEVSKGDVVVLKSGGPKMVAVSLKNVPAMAGYPAATQVFCHWFDGAKPMEKLFDAATLVRVKVD